MTTIDDLPFSLLEKILLYDFTEPTLYMAAEASKKIDFLLRERLNLRFETESENIIVHPSTGREKYIWIQDGKSEDAYLLYGASVHVWIHDRVIDVQIYNTLAERFVNLRILQVTWLNLSMFLKIGTWTSFPKLKALSLGGPRNTKNIQIKEYSSKEVLDNLSGLIAFLGRENYPKLEHLEMSIIFEERRENCLLDSILTFVSRHQKTLKNLTMLLARSQYAYSGIRIQDWLSVPNFQARLQNLTLSLQHLFVHFFPYHESEKFLQLVDRISLSQTAIETHVLLYPRFATFYTDILEDNFRTLTVVAYSMWIFYTLDCEVFQQCSLLQVLILHARPKKLEEFESENYRGSPAYSELINIEHLPKSLKYIQVVNFFIQTKDAAKFTTDFPNLKSLSLIGIGEKEDLGFSLEMFSGLLHRGVKVGVYRGFNKQLIQEGSQSDDAALAFMTLYLLKDEQDSDGSHLLSLSGYTSPGHDAGKLDQCNRRTLSFTADEFPIYLYVFEDGCSLYKVYQGQED